MNLNKRIYILLYFIDNIAKYLENSFSLFEREKNFILLLISKLIHV